MKNMSVKQLNEILNEIKTIGFNKYRESLQNEVRFYTFLKYQIVVQLIVKNTIEIDFYAELKGGYYELGDVNIIANKINSLNDIAIKYNLRQINTTERLYPYNRRGENTRTSGL